MYFQHSAVIWRDFPALVPGVLYTEGITSRAETQARADRFAAILGAFLGFTALPIHYWLLLVLMVATYLLLVDAGKVFFYRVCKF